MSFHLPAFNNTPLNPFYQDILSPLISNGKLVECPPYWCPDTVKLIHNKILSLLYRLPGVSVPLPYSWHMPHIHRYISDTEHTLAENIASLVFQSGCICGTTLPIYIDDKVYKYQRDDGVTCFLRVA